MSEFIAGFTITALILFAIGCSLDSDHDVKVKGGTQNSIELNENFCDPVTYPTQPERKACKDALLKAMDCGKAKP